MYHKITVSLLILLGSCSVNSWIINDINVPELKKQLEMDIDNEISEDELQQHRFTLIYPGQNVFTFNKSRIMFKSTFVLVFNFLLVLVLVCDACAPIREMARSISEGTEVDFEKMGQIDLQFIQPGTKWCGAGNIAENYDDLGPERATDMCCRDHDNCPDIIPAGETKHNLTNEAFYTRLSCACDEKFRKCLRDANSGTADNIGTVYFNALATKCFRKDYPTVRCVKRGGWLKRKCLKYTYNTTAEMYCQWFDVENY